MQGIVATLITRELRRAFRRVVWVGPDPDIPSGPVLAYANHQSVHDGYLLWLVMRRLLGRDFLVWMEEADRFPFFMLQGALPFPTGVPRARATAIRKTRRVMAAVPRTVLAYFPEGMLHDADDPVRVVPDAPLTRLHKVLGEPRWWPVAIHQTWRGDALPVALLTGGPVRPHPPTRAHRVLDDLRDGLRRRSPQERVVLDGTPSPHERWDFTWARRWFRHRPG